MFLYMYIFTHNNDMYTVKNTCFHNHHFMPGSVTYLEVA